MRPAIYFNNQKNHCISPLKTDIYCLQRFDTVGWRQEEHPVCKKIEWWGAGILICLQQGADDLHIWSSWCHCHPISCFIKIQIGLTLSGPSLRRLSWKKRPFGVCLKHTLNQTCTGRVPGVETGNRKVHEEKLLATLDGLKMCVRRMWGPAWKIVSN